MKIQLKSIKHSKFLSEETLAFSANVFINNKKAGFAKNSGQGGSTHVHIEPEYRSIVNQHASGWIDYLEPYPIDFSTKEKIEIVDGRPNYPRIKACDREQSTPDSCLDEVIEILLTNSLTLRDMKKIKNKVSYLPLSALEGQYVSYKIKPQQLTEEMKNKIENESDFGGWLHTLEPSEIAHKLGHVKEHDGPLVDFA